MSKKTLEEQIKEIKEKMNIISESKHTHKNEYGCVMLYFDLPDMGTIQKVIDKDDLYEPPGDDSYGIEKEPHITLLFGLHDGVSTDEVKNVTDKHEYGNCLLYEASLFENEDFDVLKFNVRYPIRGGAFLHTSNSGLAKLPHTTKYPDYHPHCTIAYLKPGKGKKYVTALKDKEYEIIPEYIKYSKPNGDGDRIEIKTK